MELFAVRSEGLMAASLPGSGRTACREPTVSTLKAVGAQPGLPCPKMICDGAMC